MINTKQTMLIGQPPALLLSVSSVGAALRLEPKPEPTLFQEGGLSLFPNTSREDRDSDAGREYSARVSTLLPVSQL